MSSVGVTECGCAHTACSSLECQPPGRLWPLEQPLCGSTHGPRVRLLPGARTRPLAGGCRSIDASVYTGHVTAAVQFMLEPFPHVQMPPAGQGSTAFPSLQARLATSLDPPKMTSGLRGQSHLSAPGS